MRGKIFRSIWLVLLVTLTISFGLTTGLLYSHFTNEQLEQLRNETKLVSQAVTLNGRDYFDRLGHTDFRITWITSDGRILYDNEAAAEIMENHLERDEIRDALQNGYGESSRYSSTLFERQLYRAEASGQYGPSPFDHPDDDLESLSACPGPVCLDPACPIISVFFDGFPPLGAHCRASQ